MSKQASPFLSRYGDRCGVRGADQLNKVDGDVGNGKKKIISERRCLVCALLIRFTNVLVSMILLCNPAV